MNNIEEIYEKYSLSTLNNLDKDNVFKIITFLKAENCMILKDIFEDYLDLFTIEYDIFVNKYNKLNKKYNGNYLKFTAEDMNLLEELFND